MKASFKKILTLIIVLVITASPALALAKPCCCIENSEQKISQDGDEAMPCHENSGDKQSNNEKKDCSIDCGIFSVSKIFSKNKYETKQELTFTELVFSFENQLLCKSLSYGIFTPPKFIS